MRPFRASGLQITCLIYGLGYLAFTLLATIPATRSLIVGGNHPESVGLETALVQLLFLLFLVGCVAAWQSALVAGLVFIIWYALGWWMAAFSTQYGAGESGVAQVLGLPMFLVGLGFIATWIAQRRRAKPS
ncbi:MAG TPA: hypothetical protein VMD08_15765 [Candidatus Baltobacteraceae bacterium]|nr:hypothetical protein [Candidatus Baltobacteraceae bacterium]